MLFQSHLLLFGYSIYIFIDYHIIFIKLSKDYIKYNKLYKYI